MKYSRSKTFLIFMLMILVVLPSYANSAANDLNLKEVIVKQEILETIYQYSYTWDSKNADELSQLFTENAVWEWFPAGAEKPKVSFTNRNKFKEFASERFKTNLADRQTRHYQTNIVFLEITNNFARTQTMILLVHKIKGEKLPKVMGSGIYKDELIKTQDGWKISRRTLIAD